MRTESLICKIGCFPLSFLNAEGWMKSSFPAFGCSKIPKPIIPRRGKAGLGPLERSQAANATLRCFEHLKHLTCLPAQAQKERAPPTEGALRPRPSFRPALGPLTGLPLSPAALPRPPAPSSSSPGRFEGLPPLHNLASPQSATRDSTLPHEPLGHRLRSAGADAPIYKMARDDVIAAEPTAEAEARRGGA